jgi:hypothetical protein
MNQPEPEPFHIAFARSIGIHRLVEWLAAKMAR